MAALRLRLQLAAVVGLGALAACGGSPSSPSGGNSGGNTGGGTPTVSSVAVTLTSPLRIGQSSQASATATLSNGTTQAVTSGWQSDAAGVATVSAAGLVTAIANGTATISVSSGGRQGQQALRVVPDYDGTWSGTYLVTACTETGIFATERFWCRHAQLVAAGTIRAVAERDDRQRQLPARPAVVSRRRRDDRHGRAGCRSNRRSTRNVRIVATWTLTAGAAGLTGSVRQRWTATGQAGEGVLDGRIVTVTRAAAAPAAATAAGGSHSLAEQVRRATTR